MARNISNISSEAVLLQEGTPEFEFAVGTSIIEEFAVGHDPSAVLRELVQNEYDAEGQKLSVEFGEEALHIYGTGKPVTDSGWRRLTVMMGTGEIAGRGAQIAAKLNGIGSKNFGLRSLFLFGDQIHVRSDGKRTLLDRFKGAYKHPALDLLSSAKKGIAIEVPYRTRKSNKLEPFGKDREQTALDSLVAEFAHTILKLAHPDKSGKSLRELTITSARCGRKITWKQTVKEVPCRQQGIHLVQRSLRLIDSQTAKAETVEELEWQRTIVVPQEYRNQTYPSYFKVPGGRIRISLSLRMQRGKPVLENSGLFFYPIGEGKSHTGTALSVTAPFEMNQDRSDIVPPENKAWNKWLLKASVDLAFDLLEGDWFTRFGASGFLALKKVTSPSTPQFLEEITKRLKTEPCWPTRAKQSDSSKAPVWTVASDVVIPTHYDLSTLMEDGKYLDDKIAQDTKIQEFIQQFGAKKFNANSLIRLVCAGNDSKNLKTRMESDEAVFRWTKYPPSHFKTIEFQEKINKALDSQEGSFTQSNYHDLRNAEIVLTANIDLALPANLTWVADKNISRFCPVPDSRRLHPALWKYRVIRKLCKEFNPSGWAIGVAERAEQGRVTDEERTALYRYILMPEQRLQRETIRRLRQAPILLDHKGIWTAPKEIIIRGAPDAVVLSPVLHFPHNDYVNALRLVESFGFRKKIEGADLIKYAKYVCLHTEFAPEAEKLFTRQIALLTESVADQLRAIPFLLSKKGTMSRANQLYIPNSLVRSCVSTDVEFVAGQNIALYKKLECLNKPLSADIVAYLEEQKSLPDPMVYQHLVDALRSEKLRPNHYQGRPILWHGTGFSCPKDTLLRLNFRPVFLAILPQANVSGTTYNNYQSLGASAYPQADHWFAFFGWFQRKYEGKGGPLRPHEIEAMKGAYALLSQSRNSSILAHVKSHFTTQSRCLLDRTGTLHCLTDAASSKIVIDDDPYLSDACQLFGIPIAFADSDENTLPFYEALGLKHLTEIRQDAGGEIQIGSELPAPAFLNVDGALANVRQHAFASAIAALAIHEARARSNAGLRRNVSEVTRLLQGIEAVVFCETLSRNYRIGRRKVQVPVDHVVDKKRLIMQVPKKPEEFSDQLALCVRDMIFPKDNQVFFDPIHRLLGLTNSDEIRGYLAKRGISWSAPVVKRRRLSPDIYVADELSAEDSQVEAALSNLVTSSLLQNHTVPRRNTVPTPSPVPTATMQSEVAPSPLPPLDDVKPRQAAPAGNWTPAAPKAPHGGQSSVTGTFRPPTLQQTTRNQEIGRRAEEIVYQAELARVAASGKDVAKVIWQSKHDAGSPYDIQSVNDDGTEIWIEVKGTTGTDGRFVWSTAEFQMALEKRSQYHLVRVYEAHSVSPTIRCFSDPVALSTQGRMRLGVADLNAEVEPLK